MLLAVVIIFCIASVHCHRTSHLPPHIHSETIGTEPDLPLMGCKEDPPFVESCNQVEKCGVYTMMIGGISKEVYCKVAGRKKFIVVQRRDKSFDGKFLDRKSFGRLWNQYKHGFGNLKKSFWIGNDALYNLTRTPRELHIVMKDFGGNEVTVVANDVQISNEDNGYELTMSSASPLPLGNSILHHNGSKFSTDDRDNSNNDCPKQRSGGWWYYGSDCGYSNLNGFQFEGESNHENYRNYIKYWGITYYDFRGNIYSLMSTVMMFRVDEEE